MIETPNSLRLKIGIFGRTNAGKSSLMNLITNQKISIVSDIKGTTTDSVKKSMELNPIGPVTFIDTPGLDDDSLLKNERLEVSTQNIKTSDIGLLIISDGKWQNEEDFVLEICNKEKIPLIIILNKKDLNINQDKLIEKLKEINVPFISTSVTEMSDSQTQKDLFIAKLKNLILEKTPEDFFNPPSILGDLIQHKKNSHVVLITPIDIQAPKGRLILPQVQTIRDALDNDATVTVLKESNYIQYMKSLSVPPDLVVCDSQCVKFMTENTDSSIPSTTFSILFSRLKGDMTTFVKGAAVLQKLNSNSKILIAESCSHHPSDEDIGKVKIPNMIHKKINSDIKIDFCSGKNFPENLSDYDLIIHCGGCMLTRREQLLRINESLKHDVPITNYGMVISILQGSITKVLSPFSEVLKIYNKEIQE